MANDITRLDSPFSYTTKDARGDLLTFRGETVDELESRIDGAIGAGTFLRITEEVAQRIAGGGSKPAQGGGGGNPAQRDWMAPQKPSQPQDGPSCPHGQREHVRFTLKRGPRAGQESEMFACPLDRNDPNKCSPVFPD